MMTVIPGGKTAGKRYAMLHETKTVTLSESKLRSYLNLKDEELNERYQQARQNAKWLFIKEILIVNKKTIKNDVVYQVFISELDPEQPYLFTAFPVCDPKSLHEYFDKFHSPETPAFTTDEVTTHTPEDLAKLR